MNPNSTGESLSIWVPLKIEPLVRDINGTDVFFREEKIDGFATGRIKCDNPAHRDFQGRHKRKHSGEFGPVNRQLIVRHIERHHGGTDNALKQRRSLDRVTTQKIREKMRAFMTAGGHALRVFESPEWRELVEEILEGTDSASVAKLCPSARTVKRELDTDRNDIVNEIINFGPSAAQEGRLVISIDHKTVRMANEQHTSCLGILLIVYDDKDCAR